MYVSVVKREEVLVYDVLDGVDLDKSGGRRQDKPDRAMCRIEDLLSTLPWAMTKICRTAGASSSLFREGRKGR